MQNSKEEVKTQPFTVFKRNYVMYCSTYFSLCVCYLSNTWPLKVSQSSSTSSSVDTAKAPQYGT